MSTRHGTLRAVIEAYLLSMGFETYEHEDGRWYWYHPELGGGRSFDGALQWWMGREEARKAASTLAG